MSVFSRTTIAVVCLCCIFRVAHAQNISVDASVDASEIGTEEVVNFTIAFSGENLPDIQTPEAPAAQGLVLSRPFPSTSRNVSILNGRMSQSLSFSWTYQPIQEGNAKIFSTSVTVDGATVDTKEIEITVVPQSQRPQRQPRVDRFDPFGLDPDPADEREVTSDDVFIRAIPSKRSAFVNEQLTIEYQLFFRTGIQLRQSRLADSWDAEGFWREELEVESRPIPVVVVENGLRYNRITLKKVAVFPTRAGDLVIDPLKIETEAALPGNGGFFSIRRNRFQAVTVSSPRISVTVRSLPQPAPSSFEGAVGSLQFSASVASTELELGNSTDLELTVSGRGNISTLEPPTLGLPGVFEVYDPEITSSVNRSRNVVTGSKAFRYVLIPRSNGSFEIPPIAYTFFDPGREEYVTINSDPATISVSGVATPTDAAQATVSGLPVDDISGRVFQTATWTDLGRTRLYSSPLVAGVLVIPLLLLAGTTLFVRRSDALNADKRMARNKMAHPLAKRHLKKASALLKNNDARGFYAELERAVVSFVGNRLNIGEKAYTHEGLKNRLRENGASADTLAEFQTLLEECDRVRFAPVAPIESEMKTAGDRAATIIVQLHSELVTPE